MWLLSLFCIPSVPGLPSASRSASLTFECCRIFHQSVLQSPWEGKAEALSQHLQVVKCVIIPYKMLAASAPFISHRNMICEMSSPMAKRGKCKLIVCLLLVCFIYIYVCV